MKSLFLILASSIFTFSAFSAEYTVISEKFFLNEDGSHLEGHTFQQIENFKSLPSGEFEYSWKNKVLKEDGTWFDGSEIKVGPPTYQNLAPTFLYNLCLDLRGVFEDIEIKAGKFNSCKIETNNETYGNSILWYIDGVPFSVKSVYRFKNTRTVSQAISIDVKPD